MILVLKLEYFSLKCLPYWSAMSLQESYFNVKVATIWRQKYTQLRYRLTLACNELNQAASLNAALNLS